MSFLSKLFKCFSSAPKKVEEEVVVIPSTKLELPMIKKVEGYTARFMEEDRNHPYFHNRGLKMNETYEVEYVNLQQPYSYMTLKNLGGWFCTSGFSFFRDEEEIRLKEDENCWSAYFRNLMEFRKTRKNLEISPALEEECKLYTASHYMMWTLVNKSQKQDDEYKMEASVAEIYERSRDNLHNPLNIEGLNFSHLCSYFKDYIGAYGWTVETSDEDDPHQLPEHRKMLFHIQHYGNSELI